MTTYIITDDRGRTFRIEPSFVRGRVWAIPIHPDKEFVKQHTKLILNPVSREAINRDNFHRWGHRIRG